MLNDTKQHFFKKLIEDTFGYYRIYDFLKMRIKESIKKPQDFLTTEAFWRAVLQRDFRYDNRNIEPLQNGQ